MFVRVAERQAYLDSMMNVHKQIKESAKKVCLQLESYKHKDFLPLDAEELKKNVQRYAQQAGRSFSSISFQLFFLIYSIN